MGSTLAPVEVGGPSQRRPAKSAPAGQVSAGGPTQRQPASQCRPTSSQDTSPPTSTTAPIGSSRVRTRSPAGDELSSTTAAGGVPAGFLAGADVSPSETSCTAPGSPSVLVSRARPSAEKATASPCTVAGSGIRRRSPDRSAASTSRSGADQTYASVYVRSTTCRPSADTAPPVTSTCPAVPGPPAVPVGASATAATCRSGVGREADSCRSGV